MALFFPAFFDKPDKISFCDQDPDENIELLLRQDWVVNIPWLFISIVLFFLPPIVLSFASIYNLRFLSGIPINVVSGALILWYLAILAYVIQSFLYWYFNIYIITNKHLIDFDFLNLVSHTITEVELVDIESSSYNISGIIRSFFNFGTVEVETAAKTEEIEFLEVPFPNRVQERIEQLRGAGNLPRESTTDPGE